MCQPGVYRCSDKWSADRKLLDIMRKRYGRGTLDAEGIKEYYRLKFEVRSSLLAHARGRNGTQAILNQLMGYRATWISNPVKGKFPTTSRFSGEALVYRRGKTTIYTGQGQVHVVEKLGSGTKTFMGEVVKQNPDGTYFIHAWETDITNKTLEYNPPKTSPLKAVFIKENPRKALPDKFRRMLKAQRETEVNPDGVKTVYTKGQITLTETNTEVMGSRLKGISTYVYETPKSRETWQFEFLKDSPTPTLLKITDQSGELTVRPDGTYTKKNGKNTERGTLWQ